ncbi:MAG: SDR family oxidoreductase [Bacteroidales bacterium]
MNHYNPFSLENKTILVTGASSGIGKAIAIECSKMGANVIVTARNEERLKETFSLLRGNNNNIIIADLTDERDLDFIVKNLAELDGLVHCAGMTMSKPFQFYSKDKIDTIMGVNFFSPLLLTQMLLKAKKIKRQSSIVFISSISGVYVANVGNSMYSASKGAINGLIKGLALELAPKNIRVNSVNPGMVETNIISSGVLSDEQLDEDKKRYPLKRYGSPIEIAYAVVYLLSDASSWTTGSNIVIDGGFTLL